MKLSNIVEKLGGELLGDDTEVSSIKSLDLSTTEDLSFFSDIKLLKHLNSSNARAIIISKEHISLVQNKSLIVVEDPFLYYTFVSQILNPPKKLISGIKTTVVLGKNYNIASNCAIYDYVVIGDNFILGENSQIYPNVVIDDDVCIGKNVIIHSNVTIYSKVKIGDNTIIHSGAVIGADGFGYAPDKNKIRHKIPHVGGVTIGDNVEIGANTTIDRGTFAPTVIDDGVVIDNLVQIGHNVRVGKHSVIAGTTGIAGSVNIGEYCIIAGHVGIGDHVNICDHAVIAGFTGINKDINDVDIYKGTFPATKLRDYLKTAAYIKKIGELNSKIKNIEQQLNLLRKYNND